MFRPLAIGLPIVIAIVTAFVVGMNAVPFSSPYFKFVIIGYVVLFPLALIFTIVGTIRGARRMISGGDVTLKERGERTMATVVVARPLNMTLRVGSGARMNMTRVRLKPDNQTPEISTTRAGSFFMGAPEPGDRVPLYLDRDSARNFFVDWNESSGAQRVGQGGQVGGLVAQIQVAVAQASRTAGGQDAGVQAAPQPRPYEPPVENHYAGAGWIEGRARIEGLKAYPDGTYDLDLYVTPRGKTSYRVAARIAVPAGTGLLEKGQSLNVRIDPHIASRVEVAWN